MGNNISSQVVVSSMEASQVDELGVTHSAAKNLPAGNGGGVAHFAEQNLSSGNERKNSEEGTLSNQLGQLETMARQLEAYRAALIAAGLPVPTLPIAGSAISAGKDARQGPSS